jgi:hypothetical protein
LDYCGIDAAFAELVAAAKRHGIPVFTIAAALVAVPAPTPNRGVTPGLAGPLTSNGAIS